MAGMAGALPLRVAGAMGPAGMAWYRPAIRPRLQAATDMAPVPTSAPGQGARRQAVLENNYAALHRRLARHLGCTELASDSLHDAWLRVDELTRQEVAERHDMSLRNVDTALRQALDHCARHTGYAAQGGVGTSRRGLRLRKG